MRHVRHRSVRPSGIPARLLTRTLGVAGGAAVLLVATGCSGSTDAQPQVFVTGSSTVEPISIRVAEKASALGITAVVEGPGTGDGFKKFCSGEGDVTGASRQIKDEEAATCADNGIEYVELPIAVDGLTVVTSLENRDVSCLDVPALYALLGPESEGQKRWSDALDLAYELGSVTTDALTDEALYVAGPGEESGTYDAFVEFAIKDIAGDRGTEEWTRADYVSSANDNLIVESIADSDHSLGWIGYAFYKADIDELKAIDVVGADGRCVAASDESLSDGSYPFSRVLYIYVNKAHVTENPAVADYIDFYLSDEGIASVIEAGYVAESDDQLAEARSRWEFAVAHLPGGSEATVPDSAAP